MENCFCQGNKADANFQVGLEKKRQSLQHFIAMCFKVPKPNRKCWGRKLPVPFPFFYIDILP